MRHLLFSTILCAALAFPVSARQPDDQGPQPAQTPAAQGDVQRVVVPFSDANRPGSLHISIVMGSITIKGSNRRDVLVEAHPPTNARPRRTRPEEPPPPGLRRLTQNGSFSVEEDRNEITVDAGSPIRETDFAIEVPVRTNLELETVMGSVYVEGVDGDLEIESVNGDVTLTNVGGSVVAHTVNGKLLATVTRPTPQKSMAFTSLNGAVDVTLPPTVKANLKLRSDQGDVYTDFDLQLRPEPGGSNSNPNPNPNPRRDGRTRIDVDRAIYGSINGGGPDFEMRTFNGNVYVRKAK